MIRRDVIMIGLSPTWLRVATMAGGAIRGVHTTALEPGDWEQAWAQGLNPLDAPLSDALKSLGVRRGTMARVAYTGPKAGAEIFALPAQGATALRAAELSLRESMPERADTWPIAVHQLHRDRPADTGESGRSHVLGIVDSAAGANILASWLRRAHLGVDGLIPMKAAALGRAVQAATSQPSTGSHAILWLGEHVTALAGWHNGRLVFARATDYGYALLADAFLRGARAQGHPNFDRPRAFGVLFTGGVPKRGQVIDPSLGLSAETVLPFLQPIIQRYVVETRQTLRFGIPESELSRTTLRLAGPGAGIPEVVRTFEPFFDLAIEKLDEHAASGAAALERAELPEVAALRPASFRILPPVESNRRLSAHLNSAVRIGAAVAVMGLAALAGWTRARTAQASRELQLLDSRVDAMTQHALTRERADRMATDLGTAAKTIKETLGERPRWMAGLALVSKACGESIELSHIAGGFPQDAGGAPALTLSGTAWPVTTHQPNARTDSLGGFLDRLSGSPIVTSAKIVSTHADVNGGDAKTFVISVQLKALAPDAALAGATGRSSTPGKPQGPTAQVQEANP